MATYCSDRMFFDYNMFRVAKKVTHYQVSSLNHIKNHHKG